MELPRRARGDELLKPGEMTSLRRRLRLLAARHDVTAVVACAFDHRTRMLPFIYAARRMAPAGARAIGSAMVDAGFEKTRVVLQQWNPNFRPSRMRVEGRIPDIFMVSSMQIHSACCKELIYDACGIDPGHRPLIIAGGPKTVYEPWDVFNTDPADRWGADVAITGEEYVLLSLLEALLQLRAGSESLRSTFIRARNSGMLDGIPGLVYARSRTDGVAEELVDTGIQRLLGDLDELPHPATGYRLLERPSHRAGLAARPLEPGEVRRYSPIGSLVLTFGCKFACPYCPIPAYNQRQHRVKSGERIVDEMRRLNIEYGISRFFGADDNFFNHRKQTMAIVDTMARAQIHGRPLHRVVRWGTEATVHDTLALRDDLPMIRAAGLCALWMGVEDMTAHLVRKGQSVNKTLEAFQLLRRRGIAPMPMMMHHDDQPLYTPGGPYGLLNQAAMLRKAGAISFQVLMLSPATGSSLYAGAYRDGLAIDSAAGRIVEPRMMDGNYVVASRARQPWRKQLNLLIAYLFFYNPIRFFGALLRPKNNLRLYDAALQVLGMWGVCQTVRRTLGWALRLMFGTVVRRRRVPSSIVPMRGVNGEPASHALSTAPVPPLVQVGTGAPSPGVLAAGK
ncbi:MAG: radical SAM protein [Planctomycetes bacterium]|nr:radical SAM protein [Planctomycetota bacterium]